MAQETLVLRGPLRLRCLRAAQVDVFTECNLQRQAVVLVVRRLRLRGHNHPVQGLGPWHLQHEVVLLLEWNVVH